MKERLSSSTKYEEDPQPHDRRPFGVPEPRGIVSELPLAEMQALRTDLRRDIQSKKQQERPHEKGLRALTPFDLDIEAGGEEIPLEDEPVVFESSTGKWEDPHAWMEEFSRPPEGKSRIFGYPEKMRLLAYQWIARTERFLNAVPDDRRPSRFNEEVESVLGEQEVSGSVMQQGDTRIQKVHVPGTAQPAWYRLVERSPGSGEFERQVLIDPNDSEEFPKGASSAAAHLSPDGRYCAYLVSLEGNENKPYLGIRDIRTGKDLMDADGKPIGSDQCRFGGFQWVTDKENNVTGFRANLVPKPGEVVDTVAEEGGQLVKQEVKIPEDGTIEYERVFEFEWIRNEGTEEGSPVQEVRMKRIFGADRPAPDTPEFAPGGGKGLAGIMVAEVLGGGKDVFMIDTETGVQRKIAEGVKENALCDLIIGEDRLFMKVTDARTPRGKLVSTPWSFDPAAPDPFDAIPPLDTWAEVIPQAEHPFTVLQDVYVMPNGKIVAQYLKDACAYVEAYEVEDGKGVVSRTPIDLGGKFVNVAPPISRAALPGETLSFDVQGFTGSRKLEWNSETGETHQIGKAQEIVEGADERFAVSQEWFEFEMEGGERMQAPMFLFRKKGVDPGEDAPIVIEGYGHAAVSMPPSPKGEWVPWLETGGTYALVNLPGGNEGGQPWFQAGAYENKPNVIHAFAAAADRVVALGYGKPFIKGHSNGGWTVIETMMKHPEKIRGAIAVDGVSDISRFQDPVLNSVGRFWEYPSGDDQAVADAWNPYRTVIEDMRQDKAGKYLDTPVLILNGFGDVRVSPANGWKLAAALMTARERFFNDDGSGTVFVETGAAGHVGKSVAERAEEQANIIAFMLRVFDRSRPDVPRSGEKSPQFRSRAIQ